jgi:2-polyprenyl-3-methyl-5-hydroxy-6-metoxy-1,4-benzoquinol methylase
LITDAEFDQYPLAKEVLEFVNRNFILFAKGYAYIRKFFDEQYLALAEELLGVIRDVAGTEENFRKRIKAFINLSIHVLVLQQKLEKTGKYECASFEDANRDVYQNKKMEDYMDGLLLSQILWPNHYRFGQHFIQNRSLTSPSSEILDAPAGDGIYSYYIARYFDYKSLYSVDISPYSILYTEQLLKHSGLDTGRITVELINIYDLQDEKRFDFITCGELLEHVEDPGKLLSKLQALLKDNGSLFLTTAIFAAADDHIFLFNNVDEVHAVFENQFQIVSELILPTSLEPYSPDMNKVPMNYACFLKKKNV